ncbi:DinB family protein [Algoriphagus boseongensis]|uniref:DinB family protein n=1 Tax=Algoriphagus boseongensis TaxID=1442587 RepID=A0A4R6TAE0_9BACT|nr:DinB family protein [Algoriphagus boseongensis]TDQ18922.1 DinB family protein [Algoriphagus boseongensis]
MNTFELPKKGDYPGFYESYISKIQYDNYPDLIKSQIKELKDLFSSKPEGWDSIAYEEGKWTPKEVLGHVIDTERIMTFRALCFARGEKKALPGFDQDPYVLNARFGQVPISNLLEDFEAQRKALLTLIRTLPDGVLDLVGNANGNPITPRALFWIIPGHFIHHLNIFKERY